MHKKNSWYKWDNYKNNKLKSKKEDTKITITSNNSLKVWGKKNANSNEWTNIFKQRYLL